MVAIILPALLFFLVALLYKLYPPKHINRIYGYRTYRSMLNQQTWDEANRYSANLMLISAGVALAVAIFGYWMYGSISMVYLSIGVMIIGIMITLWLTGVHLKKHFKDDGSPRAS